MSDDLLKSIHDKVEKISEDMTDMKVTSAKQQVSLDEHIKRSNMLEDLYIGMKEKDIEPIKVDINQLKGVYKFITLFATLASVFFGILKLFGKI